MNIGRYSVAALRRFAFLGFVWLVLTAGEPGAWVPGALAAAAGAAVSLLLLPPARQALRPVRIVAMVAHFAAGSVRGGVDVARRAFAPRMRVRPGWVAHPLRLPAGIPRSMLGAELSLMPGSLAAGESGRYLLVHYLDDGLVSPESLAAEERMVEDMFGRDTGGRP